MSAPIPIPSAPGRPGWYLGRQRTVKLGRIPQIVYSEPGASHVTHTFTNGDAVTGPVTVQCGACDQRAVTLVRDTDAGPVHACKACGGVVLPVQAEGEDAWPFGADQGEDR